MWNTFLFCYGLLGSLFNEMRSFVVLFPLYFVLTNAFNVWRIWQTQNAPFSAMHTALFAIHSVLAAATYSSAVITALHLANPRLYAEHKWFA